MLRHATLAAMALLGAGIFGIAGCSDNDHPAMQNHPDMRNDPHPENDPSRLGGPHGMGDDAPNHDELSPTR